MNDAYSYSVQNQNQGVMQGNNYSNYSGGCCKTP